MTEIEPHYDAGVVGQDRLAGDDAGDPFGELPTRLEGFVVDGDGRADWCLVQIARAEAHKRRRGTIAREEIDRWQSWQAKQDKADDATIERMTGLLRPYFDQLKATGLIPKGRQSYRLPHGRVGTRLHETKYRRDDAALIPWAESLGLVKTEKHVQWEELKKRVAPERNETGAGVIDITTGEVIEGLTVEQPSARIFEAKADMD